MPRIRRVGQYTINQTYVGVKMPWRTIKVKCGTVKRTGTWRPISPVPNAAFIHTWNSTLSNDTQVTKGSKSTHRDERINNIYNSG